MFSPLLSAFEKYGPLGLVCAALFWLLYRVSQALIAWIVKRDEQATALHLESLKVTSQLTSEIGLHRAASAGHVEEIKNHITKRTAPLHPGE